MNITIGQQLRTLRKGQKLTQQYVADKVGITRATLSNYEIDRRTPDLKTLRKLAECYVVGLDYFGIATADEILKNLYDNFVDKIVIDNDRVDITLIVRPVGRVAYKRTSGHPHASLHASYARDEITD